jgi:hypothetical protein
MRLDRYAQTLPERALPHHAHERFDDREPAQPSEEIDAVRRTRSIAF